MRPLVLSMMLVSACGDAASTEPPPTDASTPDAPVCVDCDTLTFSVEMLGPGGTTVPVTDGALVPWVWGFQGGTMVQPVVVFDAAEIAAGTVVDVVVRHEADPAAPGLLGQAVEFPVYGVSLEVRTDAAGRHVVGSLDDQLGWDELDGMRMIYTVEVSSAGFAPSARSAAIELAPMAPNLACEPFAQVDTGCVYRGFPGTATVVAIETPDPGDYNCIDASRVRLSFAVDDATAAMACAETLPGSGARSFEGDFWFRTGAGANPPTSCLAPVGITAGAMLPASVGLVERGTCIPTSFRLEVDTTACESACGL